MKALRLLVILLMSAPALAAAEPAFPIDTTTLRKLTRPAPFGTEFGATRIKFRLPDGLRFVTEDKMQEFADRLKLALVGDEAGAVVPDDMGWFTMIYLIKEDPLKGQEDMTSLNKETLAVWNEKFTADHTPRRSGAGKAWKLGNWTHPPAWDADKKVLTMGVRMSTDHGASSTDLMNFKMFLYGPEQQIVCLQCVAPMADAKWEKPVLRTQKLSDEITFPSLVTEPNAQEEMMYYAKLGGGGLLGALIVIAGARMMVGGGRRSTSASRRQGLPR